MRQNIKPILFFIVLLFLFKMGMAQQVQDSIVNSKAIYIIHTDRLTSEKKDSVEFLWIAGNSVLRQGSTLLYCDSAVINKSTNIMEAFGHVHINDADSIHTYADYAKYLGNEKKAFLRKNVKLTDGKGVLTTPELEYDLNTKIGSYTKGGKLTSNKSVLTSTEGFYYGETKDAWFKKKVVLVDPEQTVETDTLIYNTATNIATFTAATKIKGKDRNIFTREGYYDLSAKKSYFAQRPEMQDGSSFLIADEVANDDSTGFGEARGNVIFRDTAQGVTILANNLKSNKKEGSFLATQQPIMIIKQETDSLYIAADTFHSGKITTLQKTRFVPDIRKSTSKTEGAFNPKKDNVPPVTDTSGLEKKPAIDSTTEHIKSDSLSLHQHKEEKELQDNKKEAKTAKDTTSNITSFKEMIGNVTSIADTNSITIKDSTNTAGNITIDTTTHQSPEDSLHYLQSHFGIDMQNIADSSHDRFIEAYHNVRIFSDSLQAKCDSLFYTVADSAFRMFRDPIVWGQLSQITGDTIYLFTQNQKPERMDVFENSMIINRVDSTHDYFNQIKGRWTKAYFVDGNMEFAYTRGSQAESVYYVVDEDNKFVGVNKAASDVIEMYFTNQAPAKVKLISSVTGTMSPMSQVNHEELKLRGFAWHEDIRPKSKFDLFIIPEKENEPSPEPANKETSSTPEKEKEKPEENNEEPKSSNEGNTPIKL